MSLPSNRSNRKWTNSPKTFVFIRRQRINGKMSKLSRLLLSRQKCSKKNGNYKRTSYSLNKPTALPRRRPFFSLKETHGKKVFAASFSQGRDFTGANCIQQQKENLFLAHPIRYMAAIIHRERWTLPWKSRPRRISQPDTCRSHPHTHVHLHTLMRGSTGLSDNREKSTISRFLSRVSRSKKL